MELHECRKPAIAYLWAGNGQEPYRGVMTHGPAGSSPVLPTHGQAALAERRGDTEVGGETPPLPTIFGLGASARRGVTPPQATICGHVAQRVRAIGREMAMSMCMSTRLIALRTEGERTAGLDPKPRIRLRGEAGSSPAVSTPRTCSSVGRARGAFVRLEAGGSIPSACIAKGDVG